MKIAFSTLGCPQWTWDEILATASDLGFNGVEVRGIGNEMYMPKAKPFLEANLTDTIERLSKLKLQIPIFTSSCYLFDKNNINQYLQEGKEYIDLAERVGVPFIRVLGDANPEPGEGIDLDFIAKNLQTLANYADKKNVSLLIETNGVLANSENMLYVLKKSNSLNVFVLWDVHHPFRYGGESASYTYEKLKDYIRYIHIKDSVIEAGKVKYKMLGYGDVPVSEILEILKENKFDGYVSLEWVKRWCLELEEPGVVFSHFISYIRREIA